ncbi:MAG: alkaline phosphatase family protein [Alphaproteobacteria bacterium PA4]|nr:MAG: alkaline phosphatase family protein [Alphaproteobacteria bacterium PA4]
MRRLLLLLSLLFAAAAQAAPVPVILVSIDGFRPDYLDRNVTPHLNALAAAGTRATAMRPSWPSITFPNHYTLVTGLRPDRNGIVANTMEDPAIPGVRFSMANRDAVGDRRWWDQAEPIWVTAERAGLATATMFWPGSEAPVHGIRPRQWMVFDDKLPEPARVDQILAWATQPQPPALMTLYFDSVDHAGHEAGPDAATTTDAVAAVDTQIGRLIDGLNTRGIAANIIVVSDHGMAATDPARVVRLDLLAPQTSYRAITAGSFATIAAAPGQEAALAKVLLAKHDHMQCWPKADVPKRLHYGRNARVPAFVCLAETGWLILPNLPTSEMKRGGAHGYDNLAPEMAATFVAAGPAFKPGTRLPAFDNVDVQPLLLRLLGLKPMRTDGSIKGVAAALR